MNAKSVTDYIVKWLKDYASNAKTKGLLVGVSGGIDSAVVSTLAAETGLSVLCLEMPIHQNKDHVTRAQAHISSLKKRYPNVRSLQVDLTTVFESFRGVVPNEGNSPDYHHSLANTRSRLRMTTLYYFAGLYNFLVVGTGNKVEDFGVGFFTKYGDGGVDISPIADLMKSEVYRLGLWLKVPKAIIEARPSDGLFDDDRSDEDQLGASYSELEWAMHVYEAPLPPGALNKRKKEVLEIYSKIHRANKHKMDAIPVCKIPKEIKQG